MCQYTSHNVKQQKQFPNILGTFHFKNQFHSVTIPSPQILQNVLPYYLTFKNNFKPWLVWLSGLRAGL